jgi:hypothetical protein
MKRFDFKWRAVAALAVLAAIGLPKETARAASSAVRGGNGRIDAPGSEPAGELVIDLPEDGQTWHTSVFTGVRLSARERDLLDWFTSDPRLNRLRRQTHFHHFNRLSAVWPRYANLTADGLPVIVLQDATGKVVFKASGDAVPRAPWPLVKGIVECIRAHCPHCPRPRPTPQPQPEPEPDETPDEQPVVPDIVGPNKDTPEIGRDDTLPVTIAVFVVALAGGFVAAARGGRK